MTKEIFGLRTEELTVEQTIVVKAMMKMIENKDTEIAELTAKNEVQATMLRGSFLVTAKQDAEIARLREALGKILVGYADKYHVEHTATLALAQGEQE
jgi:hypothetical protein